eukprot:6400624-Pyramimonas_sp.AAC.1
MVHRRRARRPGRRRHGQEDAVRMAVVEALDGAVAGRARRHVAQRLLRAFTCAAARVRAGHLRAAEHPAGPPRCPHTPPMHANDES